MHQDQETGVVLRATPVAHPDDSSLYPLDGSSTRRPADAGSLPDKAFAGIPPGRIFLDPARWRGAVAAALEEERAYGHAFILVPALLAVGAVTWFRRAETLGCVEIAVLACIFGMAAFGFRHRTGLWRAGARAGLIVVAGMACAALETARTGTVMLDAPVTTTIEGQVLAREVTDRGAWRYVVALRSTREPRLRRPPSVVTLLVRSADAPTPIGAVIGGRARLSPPSGPALRGLNDFAFDSFFKGIGAVGYLYGRPETPAIPSGPDTNKNGAFGASVAAWREAIGDRIRGTIGGDAGAIAAALVTAEERAIGRETIAQLRDAGLGHVLAISGLNMVLAAGTLLVGVRTGLSLVPGLAHRVSIKKIAAAGALLMVCLYLLISGGAVSAVRSFIMIAIMLVAVFFDRPSISLRNVALAAVLILAVTPSAVTGPGFQMSFAATLGLVAGYARWRERKSDGRSRPMPPMVAVPAGFFGGLLLSSAIGGGSTLIYAAAHFNRLPAYGLLGNLLAMPIIGIVVMPAGLIAMLLMPFGLDTLPLMVMGAGIEAMMAVARLVSSFGGQVMTGRVPGAAFALVAWGGVLACLLRTRLALAGLVLGVAGLGVAVLITTERPAVVIAEDGRLVALLDGSMGATNRKRPPAFVYGQWTRALRLEEHRAPLLRSDLALVEPAAAAGGEVERPPFDPDTARVALRRLIAEAAVGRFACVPRQWCAAVTVQGWRVVAVEDRRLVGAACDLADIVVTSGRPPFRTCRSGALLASLRLLRRTGALEIIADPTAPKGRRIVQAMNGLDRPWQRHRTYDWRSGDFVDDEGEPEAAGEDS